MFKEGITFSHLKEVVSLFRINMEEVNAIQQCAAQSNNYLDEFIQDLNQWIPRSPEFAHLFALPGTLEQVKEEQKEYWRLLFSCQLDDNYLQSRYKIGDAYAENNLPISAYIAGMGFSAEWWIKKLASFSNVDMTLVVVALNKVFSLDIALISASYTQASNTLIEQQNRALMDLSIPTIQLWEDVLILPILGVLDSQRAHNMTEVMLTKILETSAHSIILDITGVPAMDSSVANHLIKITKATKLMGCECILCGIGPSIAQTLVQLGINLGMVETSANLQSAFEIALKKNGLSIKAIQQ